jgi:hypothetical protein
LWSFEMEFFALHGLQSFARLRWHLSQLPLVLLLPKACITLFGGSECQSFYQNFTRPHQRYKIIKNKCWGIALLPLPNSFEEYLAGGSKVSLRRKRRKCLVSGFQFVQVDPLKHLQEIRAVNISLPVRQGRPLPVSYTDTALLRSYFESRPTVYAVLNRTGVLKAYIDAPIVGDVCILSRIMGHGEDLHKGIMYFCVSEVIRHMIQEKARHGRPHWVMYDTFFGALGMQSFKKRLGFAPYRTRWRWSPGNLAAHVPARGR